MFIIFKNIYSKNYFTIKDEFKYKYSMVDNKINIDNALKFGNRGREAGICD